MALFDKKDCSVCGAKIGMLGNRKLEDGNCCKDCAKQLSPWMTDRRRTTVEDIKAHLAYREENKGRVQQFNPTMIAGEYAWKVLVDPAMGAFAVSRSSNWRGENPDIIPLSQVVSCEIERAEHRNEVYQRMPDGSRKSYFPARYEYTYDFKARIQVNTPWFNEIAFSLNNSSVDRYAPEYRQCEFTGDQIRSMLLSGNRGGMMGSYQQPVQFRQPAQAAPAGNWFCPNCGTPNQGKFCQGCGTARP